MIYRFWHFSWPHLRAVIIALTLAAIVVQVNFYINREVYTPATEEELYCLSPTIIDFQHKGNGQIRLVIEGVEKNMSVASLPGPSVPKVTPEGNAWLVQATLQPGFNTLVFDIDGQQQTWNAMFTPQEAYAAQGNQAANLPGVVGLYPSTLCMGKPVLPVADWSPRASSSSSSSSELSEDWKRIFVESIRKLEGFRGIPDEAIETAGLEEVVQRLEDKTSQGWCSQIALYAVAKLDKKLPVRVLSSGGYFNNTFNVRTGGHLFLEYLDPRTQRWVISDPTSYIFAVRDRAGLPLNAIELSRVLSLPLDLGTESLRFDIVDPKTATIAAKSFAQLPDDVQRDLQFYFRPINTIKYFSGHSSMYRPTFLERLKDWLQTDRRFVFQVKKPSISVVSIRIASFWLILAGIFTLLFGEYAWRKLRAKRKQFVN